MPFCYRCGEDTSHAYWNREHRCCKDCSAIYDLDRFREIRKRHEEEEHDGKSKNDPKGT